MRGFIAFAIALFVFAGSAVVPAVADDKEHCVYSSSAPNTAASRDACTRLIDSGKYRGVELAKFYVKRINAYYMLNQYDRAIADADVVLGKIFPHRPGAAIPNEEVRDAYYYRGNSYNYIKQPAKAVPDLTEAIEYRPSDYNALFSRGESHLALNQLDRAIADFGGTIRLDASHYLAHRYRALAFEKKGDFVAALADARRSAEIEQTKGYSGSSGIEIAKRVEAKLAAAGIPVPPVSKAEPPGSARAKVEPAPTPAPSAPPAVAAVSKSAPVPTPVLIPSLAPREVRVALVIGNGKYRHATPLANPTNDAADVANALRKLGFEVIEGRDLDKRGMEDKAREFGRKLDKASLALFFYAGHGLQVGGKNYLAPIDARLERSGDLSFETIDVSQILAQMEADQRVNLIFLDACRDNPLARSLARSLGTRSGSVGQGLATIQSAVGTMIAYATQPDNVALDGDGQRNSPFTTALLKHVATPGLEVSSLMKRVRADVIKATSNRQVPWDHSSLVGDVVLAR